MGGNACGDGLALGADVKTAFFDFTAQGARTGIAAFVSAYEPLALKEVTFAREPE